MIGRMEGFMLLPHFCSIVKRQTTMTKSKYKCTGYSSSTGFKTIYNSHQNTYPESHSLLHFP